MMNDKQAKIVLSALLECIEKVINKFMGDMPIILCVSDFDNEFKTYCVSNANKDAMEFIIKNLKNRIAEQNKDEKAQIIGNA